jgi:hypothetical protein
MTGLWRASHWMLADATFGQVSRIARKPAPMLVPHTSTVRMTLKVWRAAALALQTTAEKARF